MWLALYKNFSRVERFGIGQKVDLSFLSLLELTFYSSYLNPEQKKITLSRAITKLDSIKFFAQLAWESKLIHTEKYSELSQKLEEIGRMLGGWRKGLETKTPPENQRRT